MIQLPELISQAWAFLSDRNQVEPPGFQNWRQPAELRFLCVCQLHAAFQGAAATCLLLCSSSCRCREAPQSGAHTLLVSTEARTQASAGSKSVIIHLKLQAVSPAAVDYKFRVKIINNCLGVGQCRHEHCCLGHRVCRGFWEPVLAFDFQHQLTVCAADSGAKTRMHGITNGAFRRSRMSHRKSRGVRGRINFKAAEPLYIKSARAHGIVENWVYRGTLSGCKG